MQCPRCQHENRSGAKFCEKRATLLATSHGLGHEVVSVDLPTGASTSRLRSISTTATTMYCEMNTQLWLPNAEAELMERA
jgi:hypothetical protein